MRKSKSVWYYAAILLITAFLFFTNDFGLIDIQKTAIITAMAIDKEGEEYKVTAQLAVPKPSNQDSNTQAVQIEGRGDTINKAVSRIGNKTGWVPKLVYCHLIIIGKEAAEEDVFESLEFFLRDEYMPDSCILACAEEKAADLLSVQTPVDDIPSLAIKKILSSQAYRSGSAAVTTLKDFAVGYYGEAKSGFMPVIRAVNNSGTPEGSSQDKNKGSGESSSGENSGGEKSGNQGGAQSEEQKVFDCTKTALFFEGKKTGELNPEETFVFSLVNSTLKSGTFEVERDGKNCGILINGNKSSVKFYVDSGIPKLSVNIKAKAKNEDCGNYENIVNVANSYVVPDEILRSAEEKITRILNDIFDKCAGTNCDLFEITNKLRRFENKYFNAYKRDILKRTKPEFTVKISSSKK